jgi:methionyl-tRNA formyltransferase
MVRIAVLGAGPEADAFLHARLAPHEIVVFGAHPSNAGSVSAAIASCAAAGIPVTDSLDGALAHQPDVVFMVSWPRLVPPAALVRCRFINVHGALLPAYRGMHGGTWAIVNGERLHGYTLHEVDAGMDTGPIYYQGVIEPSIDDDVNVIRRLILEHYTANIGDVFCRIASGELRAVPQDESLATHVGRRTPEDGRIDWRISAWRTYGLMRALAPPYTPGAFTTWNGEPLWITRARWRPGPAYVATEGQVVARMPGEGVLVKCGDQALLVTEVAFRGDTVEASELFRVVGARLGT